MFKKLLSVCAALLAAASSLPAAQVLVKPIQRSGWSLYSEMDKSWDDWPAFTTAVPKDDTEPAAASRRPRSRAPGFRTASSSSYVFTVGMANPGAIVDEGFISKLDPSGSVIWTKLFTEVMSSAGWCPMDVKVIAERIYVCGVRDQSTSQGFVAKLTLDGTLEDYSLFTSTGTGSFARATSLAVSSYGGGPSIVVIGDALGDTVRVQQRQRLAAADVYSTLKLHRDGTTARSDVFIVRMDANLSANWATTMGFERGDDYANAVTTDNDGNIYLALNSAPNADYDGGGSRIHQVDGHDYASSSRPIYSGSTSGTLAGVQDSVGTGLDLHFDFYPGYWGMLLKIDSQSGLNARIRRMFLPCRCENGENGAGNHISDLAYYDGSVYVAGEYRGRLRPQMESTDSAFFLDSAGSLAGYDAFVTRLDASTLNAQAWRLFSSSGDEFIHEMTVDAGGVYLAGTAGGSLDTFKTYGAENQIINLTDTQIEKSTLGGSVATHLFWQKLNLGTLSVAANGHLTPVEDTGANIAIPSGQRNAGITTVGDAVVFVGGRSGGDVTFGPVGERKTLPAAGWSGFAGYLKAADMTFLREVTVTINSAFGTPSPHRGLDTVASGRTITAAVPPEIYEAAGGAIIDPQDTEAIRSGAVTRRVCTGYQFRNSPVNGTANTVTFVASADTELTFLWRTEHAVEIASDLSGTDGLTSTAAGNPEPAVQKHWIRENEQFTAFIDGAEADIAVPGVRWRSTGFIAGGCVASAQGVASGSLYAWSGYQPRQQTAKITVGSPGRIVWKWMKEMSVRVGVNSFAASSAPRTWTDWVAPQKVTPAAPGTNALWTLEFPYPVEVTRSRVRTRGDWAANRPDQLSLMASDGWWIMAVAPTSGINADSVVRLDRSPNGTLQQKWIFAGLATGNYIDDPYIDSAEVESVSFGSAGPPAAHISSGSGEFWYPVGVTVTATAPASVSSGISNLALKGYTGGQGAVTPYDQRGVTTKTFTLTTPSYITWDYARAIYPETVVIGQPVTFSGVTGVDAANANRAKAPLAGNVLIAPSGSGFNDMVVWDAVSSKALVLRPGKFTVEFENKAATDDPAQNVIVEVTAVWGTPDYTSILEAPPVNVDPSAGDRMKFLSLAYSEGRAQVTGTDYSAPEPGRSVLLFSTSTGGSASGNLAQEPLAVKVVNTLSWAASAQAYGQWAVPVDIAREITSPDHESAVGHNGCVLSPLAPVNISAHNRETSTGPIFAVNENFPDAGRWSSGNDPAQTRILAGRIVEFDSPDDLLLNPATVKVAVALNGDMNRTVNGVLFQSDGAGGNGGSATANGITVTTSAPYEAGDYAAEPSFTGGSPGSAGALAAIMRDIRWAEAPAAVSVTVSGLTSGKVYNLQLLTNEASSHDRRYDIAVNSVLAVDNCTSSGHSAGRRWRSDNSYAWTAEYVAPASGILTVQLARQLGGNAANGADNNPILSAVIVHEVNSVQAAGSPVINEPGTMTVAWYQQRDGIAWPWKAVRYAPQWPTAPGRIVTASRLGSEGMKAAAAFDGAGLPVSYGGAVSSTSPVWKRPAADRQSVTQKDVRYEAVTIVPNLDWNSTNAYGAGWNAQIFVYAGTFDPARPLENLITSSTSNGGWTWLSTLRSWGAVYHIVFSQDQPGDPVGGFNLDMQGGGWTLNYQPEFGGTAFSDPVIYHQSEAAAPGYNPNEEHALIAPSFLNPSRPAAFALRADLNRTAADQNFTSRPYALVQYTDKTDPANPIVRMAAYGVADEDAFSIDPRLPAYNRAYTYLYQGEAGQRLLPPYPLDVVIGPSTWPEETNAENVDGRIAYHEDKKNNAWLVSGDTDTDEDIRAELYYPVRADFWHPTLATGAAISLGHLPGSSPVRDIFYNTVWPADAAVLKAGETLTFSGGEYFADGGPGVQFAPIFAPGDFVETSVTGGSTYFDTPANDPEGPGKAIDRNSSTKYLSFRKEGSGIHIVPASGASVPVAISLTSANDAPERDPAYWVVQGSNASDALRNELSPDPRWTTIAQGSVSFSSRFQTQTAYFSNATSYTRFRVFFTALANSGAANSVQIAEIQLLSAQAPAAAPVKGLPGAVAWQCGKQLFDSANPTMAAAQAGSNYLARVFPALSKREVALPFTSVPDTLQPASGNIIVEGLIWRFKQLPASLQKRLYYDASSQKLGFRGYLNDKTLGDGDLLAAPGAQTVLQANVITEADAALISALSSSAAWTNAVSQLVTLSRSPLGATASNSYPIGLEPASGGALPATVFGPGLAVITNPDMQYSGTSATLPDGYITIAENDDESLGDAPVAIHVMKVTRQKYRGSIAVLRPENVFDEKLTLRHTADFGGDANDLFFEWFYREEDGRDLNPPGINLPTEGTPTGADWTVFASGNGLNEIQLSGASPATLTDNVFYVRYRHKDDSDNWSAWGGAANSREPKVTSPAAAVDIAYVAQLAPGWIKRVADGVNLFDARIRDFRNNNSPATYTSMLQQAGQRWEGPVAFNPQKDAIENFGLIELYQTVLDRGMDLSIDLSPGTNGVNTALLNAANRIAGLYTLMGNEAMADAADPTVGFSTVSGQFGRLSPVLHSFRNQTGNLLQEELALLRGRGEVGARPAYNRLLWNFTNGEGEAAYVMNYGITDLNNDGFLNDVDARRLYPQGHGDAWGHYTMAMKGYYDLAVLNNFTWISRNEKYLIDGIVLDVDYLDERAFAKTAAARAQCGAQLVDLVYRQAYTENPNGQWQGYRDTNTDRAWGVFETAQRTGTAALCDWLTANALLKGEETDTSKTGIRKVDRITVGELSMIAAQAAAIQSKLDSADRGMNPAGLDPDVVPFDIDPVLTDRTNVNAATHFEQIYSRAVGSNRNALLAFNHASEAGLQVRRTAASTEELRKQALDQDLAYRNRLIEYFGTPYEGMIGSGKAYPEGYSGPDLYLFLYMDQVSAGGDLLPELDDDIVPTTIVPGLRNLATDTNPFLSGATGVDALLKDTVSTYFPADVQLPSTAGATVKLNLPRRASGYALTAPADWGQRRSPGAIQAAIQQLVQAEWKLRMAVDAYEGTSDDFKLLLRKFEIKSGIASEKIRLAAYAENRQDAFHIAASAAFSAGAAAEQARDFLESIADTVIEGMPKVVGLASDATAPARAIIKGGASAGDVVLRILSTASQIAQYRLELEAEEAMVEMDKALLTEDLRSELVDILAEIEKLANDEVDLRMAVIDALESMRAASDRVRTVTQEGLAIIDERTVFNQRVASTTTQQRYEDYTFRVTHTEALRKYQSSFDLAARSAYLAGKAYAYELNLPDNHAANATPLLAEMLRTRTLGEWDGTSPVIGQGGIAEQLAMLKTNFDTLKGQLGFNNPATEVNSFSVRAELGRIGLSARVNADWRTKLETYRIPDLWNYQYENNGVNYGYVFRRYCRPFAPEAAGAQPALVIPFDSSIAAGKNWFGKTLAGGDSSFNASNYSTKIRSAGIRFDGYNNTAMSQTPQVYLVPVGMDRMFLPDSTTLADRSWNVVDQRIPVPLPISPSNLADPNWQPFTGSANGFFEEIRKFSSFRAYHDAGGYSPSEMLSTGRLVGRSVWNTQWVLIIPSATLLNDPANPSAGIDTLIYGAPLPGFTQGTAGTTNRDLIGARDIRILLQTYSISGN